MSEPPLSLKRLQNRSQFLRAARGRKYATPSLVLQAVRQSDEAASDGSASDGSGDVIGDSVGVGFTATKKLGNAVVRNRAKRRLRAAAEAVLPQQGRAGYDYVLIGRQGTLERPFQNLLEDLELALQMISKPRSRDQKKRRQQ